jgi:hypothetical protein
VPAQLADLQWQDELQQLFASSGFSPVTGIVSQSEFQHRYAEDFF